MSPRDHEAPPDGRDAGNREDARHMRRALELAARGRGRTAPNPMVGAVIVREGELLAEGWHRAPGMAHAEVDALSRIDGRADGATMYVNLEPCCHHGKTPPCTDAILAAGISRVVVGMVDPFPRVSGQGIRILREAGLTVEVGVEGALARELNRGFILAQEARRPAVVLKAALTLDGRIADAEGHSQWITGSAARAAGHRLRDACDAILVGAGTLRADDPSLNTRGVEGGRDALPVVLDTELSCPADARLLSSGRRPVLVCAEDAPERSELEADIVRVPRADRGVDLSAALAALVERGVHTLLVEGGATVHRSFLDAGLVDQLHLFVAPKLLAGGPGWVAGAPWALEDAPRFRVRQVGVVGGDVHIQLSADPGG